MSRPYLPVDSPKIRELRRRLQKPYEAEALEAWLFHRRISIYITNVILPLRSVRPNHITLLALFIAVAGTLGIWFVADPYQAVLALVIYHLAYLLDVIDGELARARKQYSRRGVWADRVLSEAMSALAVSAGLLVWLDHLPVWAGGFILLPLALRSGARAAFEQLSPSEKGSPMRAAKQRSLALNLLSLASSPGGFILWLFAGQLLRAPQVALVFGVSFLWMSTIYQMLFFWRTLGEGEP